MAKVVRATEPESTSRSTGSLLVSVAAGTEPSTVRDDMLANQVPPLLHFLGKLKMVLHLAEVEIMSDH